MRTTLIAMASLVVLPTTAAAERLTVVCPVSVSGGTTTPGATWVSVTVYGSVPGPWLKSPLILHDIAVYSGDPKEGASLVPDDDRPLSGRLRVATWALKGEHWVGCHYRGETNFLAMRLPASVRSCQSQYEQLKTGVRMRRFQCEVGDA